MYDVITVGSSTIDAFAKVESELIKIKTVSHTEELIAYPSGSKILISDLKFYSGGGGTNTAVCFSRLGFKVGYIGKVGSDNNSVLILDQLKEEKIDFLGKKSEGVSGYSVILDSLEGDRTILAYKGVNNSLDYSEINTKRLSTKWFYFSSMVEKSYETLEKLAGYAKENKIKVAFNPSNYLAKQDPIYLRNVLSKTDLLILNREESTLIAGNYDIPELIRELMKLGPLQVVITDGKKGAYTINSGVFYHVIPKDIASIETTGAGDAFAATFVAGVLKKKDTTYCLQMATKNAESVVMHQGAKNGLLPWKKLHISLKELPKVVKKKI